VRQQRFIVVVLTVLYFGFLAGYFCGKEASEKAQRERERGEYQKYCQDHDCRPSL